MLFKRIVIGSFFLAACMIGQPAFAFKISKLVKMGGNLSPLKIGGKLNPLRMGAKIGGGLNPLKIGGKLNPLRMGGGLNPLKMGGYNSVVGALKPDKKKSYTGSAAIAPVSALSKQPPQVGVTKPPRVGIPKSPAPPAPMKGIIGATVGGAMGTQLKDFKK